MSTYFTTLLSPPLSNTIRGESPRSPFCPYSPYVQLWMYYRTATNPLHPFQSPVRWRYNDHRHMSHGPAETCIFMSPACILRPPVTFGLFFLNSSVARKQWWLCNYHGQCARDKSRSSCFGLRINVQCVINCYNCYRESLLQFFLLGL